MLDIPYPLTGAEIRAWREARGLSQSGLARALRVAPATVSRWEGGEREPPPYLALALERLAQKVRPKK